MHQVIHGNPQHVLSSHLPDSFGFTNGTTIRLDNYPKQLGNGFMVSRMIACKVKLQDLHKNLTWL